MSSLEKIDTTSLPDELAEKSPGCMASDLSDVPCTNPAVWGAKGKCCSQTAVVICNSCRKKMLQMTGHCDVCGRTHDPMSGVFTWWRI